MIVVALFGVGSQIISSIAYGQGKGKGKGKGKDQDKDGTPPGQGGVYFRREDYAAVQHYYNGPKDLPPGLRKKYYRTGKLPPGWEKKIRPFPPELVRVLPPPPPNCERGYIDGVAVVYDVRTRIIVDFLDVTVGVTLR